MLNAAVAALACLCLARTSPAEPHSLRLYTQALHSNKDISSILANIEERLRVLDTVNAVQEKQSRKLEVIQDKLDRVETTLTLKLERAQLAAERLEHRLHMLQTNVQASIKESSDKIERSQAKIAELTLNLTTHINTHKILLDKVNGAYSDTWHRGMVVEGLMRDGLSLVNATRRELADGLRALYRKQRDAKLTPAELETIFTKRLNENANKLDIKMQEVLDVQKRFLDPCQRVQQDDPNHVANKLDKLFEALLDKIQSVFFEMQTIKITVRDHDSKVMKLLNTMKTPQVDSKSPCRRLESAFRNTSFTIFKENELKQLTEKFVALTDRADAALQKLEIQLGEDDDAPIPENDVTAAADQIYLKLKGIKSEEEMEEDDFKWDDDEAGYFEDGGSDMMDEDRQILSKGSNSPTSTETTSTRPSHRRHLHKHPHDPGPNYNKLILT